MARQFRSSSSRPLRPMDWGGFAFNGFFSGGNVTCGWIVSPDDVSEIATDPTIMSLRTKFSVSITLASAGNSVENSTSAPFGVALGIIDWSGQRVARDFLPGTHAPTPVPCPNPLASQQLDWMQRIVYPIPPLIGEPFIIEQGLDKEYLSQAKRRMGNTKGLLYCVAAVGVEGQYSFDTRYLIKE